MADEEAQTTEDTTKAGARNSRADSARIQLINALAVEMFEWASQTQDHATQIANLTNELGANGYAETEGAAMAASKGEAQEGGLAIGSWGAVKAVSEDELDVTAMPFDSKDGDRQWFDAQTEIMEQAFSTPLVAYQHGISQGAKGLQETPLVVGHSIAGTLKKMADGWHVRVKLNMALKEAQAIMKAALERMVAVSSGSISHLARLDIGGKRVMYQKDKPGRIAVWPLAEISLWEKGNGNMRPANQFAVALPAMKAIYREAGLPFPDDIQLTSGGTPEAVYSAAARARQESIKQEAGAILAHLKEL